jgi:hypothetical protein
MAGFLFSKFLTSLQCTSGFFDYDIEGRGIRNCNFAEHFSVKLYICLFAAVDKFAVADLSFFAGGV